jgi:hypothetical protein
VGHDRETGNGTAAAHRNRKACLSLPLLFVCFWLQRPQIAAETAARYFPEDCRWDLRLT